MHSDGEVKVKNDKGINEIKKIRDVFQEVTDILDEIIATEQNEEISEEEMEKELDGMMGRLACKELKLKMLLMK